jgi:hypothetical protein
MDVPGQMRRGPLQPFYRPIPADLPAAAAAGVMGEHLPATESAMITANGRESQRRRNSETNA